MGRKPDRSFLEEVFGDAGSVEIKVTGSRPNRPTVTPSAPASRPRSTPAAKSKSKPTYKSAGAEKPEKLSNTKNARFHRKLEGECFQEFDHNDWIEYFKHKADQHGIRYIVGNFMKEQSVIKSLMRELHWDAIKGMIDFIFDSDQDITDKRTASIYLLSSGWINTMYQNSQLWLSGEYTPRSQKKNDTPKRVREWTGAEPVASSRKDTGTGISYGKPIRGEEDGDKPRSGVRF